MKLREVGYYGGLRRAIAEALTPPVNHAEAERLQQRLAELMRERVRSDAVFSAAIELWNTELNDPCPYFCDNGVALLGITANSAGWVEDLYGPCPVCAELPEDALTEAEEAERFARIAPEPKGLEEILDALDRIAVA